MIDAAALVNVAPQIAAIETLLYSLEDRLHEAVDSLTGSVDASLSVTTDRLAPVLARALDAAEINLPTEGADGPLDWSSAERLLAVADSELTGHEASLATIADRAVSSVDDRIAALIPNSSEVVGSIVGVFAQLVDGLLGSLTNETDLWQTLMIEIRDRLGGNVAAISDWGTAISAAIIGRINGSMPSPQELGRLTESPRSKPELQRIATVEQYIAILESQPRIITNIVNALTALKGVFSWLDARNTGFINGVTQASMYEALTTPLGAGELADMLIRQIIGPDWAADEAKRSGISNELFDLKVKARETLLTPPSILDYWRRTGDDSVLDTLVHLGYSDDSVSKLKALSLAVPTASDVVRFLARDVFDEGAIRTGGLDQDFSQKYREDVFNAAGVSRDTARLYWMAHWSLPSPSMGYQMLHRGLISQDELTDLLKLADYAPGWVDRLAAISYNVPGRVDVRRMFQLGVIPDHAGLVAAYQRMGYSPDDSETLAVFAERLRDQGAATEIQRRYGPLAHEIMRSFVVGVVSEVQARGGLASLGFATVDIDNYIAGGFYERATQRADKIRKALGREYVRGYADEAQTRAQLDGYGFDADEASFLLDQWGLERELQEESEASRHAKDLSKSEIVASYGARLLSRPDAEQHLLSLGYDAGESGLLLALEDSRELRADATAVEAATRAQFLARQITAAQAHDTLAGFGYQPTRLAALLTRWETELASHRPTITSGQLERMLMQGIIDQDRLYQMLLGRGYTESDANSLMTLYGTDVAIADEQLAEKRREFEIREARLTQEGTQRIGLTSRGLDIKEAEFSQAQTAVQQRFNVSVVQRAALQQQRLDSASTLQTQRISAETARSAAALVASHERQEKSLAAEADRVQKQIDAANTRQQNALKVADAARQQRADLAAQSQAAADVRQKTALAAQSDRQSRTIEAATVRATDAAAVKLRLQTQHENATADLAMLRDQLQQARDIRQNADRINTESRTEQQRIRTEQRASANKAILASDAASNASQLQASQLSQAAAIATVNAQYAALQAEIASQRQQAALAARQAAEAALAAATPASTFLDVTGA